MGLYFYYINRRNSKIIRKYAGKLGNKREKFLVKRPSGKSHAAANKDSNLKTPIFNEKRRNAIFPGKRFDKNLNSCKNSLRVDSMKNRVWNSYLCNWKTGP